MEHNLTFLTFLLAPPLAGGLLLLLLLFKRTRRQSEKPGWFKLLILNLCSCFTLVGLSFLGGEVYYRYIYDTTDSLAYTKVSKQWVQRYCIYNSADYRDNINYLLAKQPGVPRISFLGDSFTAGHGIKSVEDRFPNMIRAVHPEWEIHVLAKFGLDTAEEINLLKADVAKGYNLDNVVLVYCLNDIADLFPDWHETMDAVYADVKNAGWLRRHSFFLDILHHRYKAARDPVISNYYFFVRDAYNGRLWELQQMRLKALKAAVETNGGRLLVVTFPFMQSLGKDYAYREAHHELSKFWSELDVPHLDLLNCYSNLSAEHLVVSRFDAHPNELANSIAAENIEAFLKTNLPARSLLRHELPGKFR